MAIGNYYPVYDLRASLHRESIRIVKAGTRPKIVFATTSAPCSAEFV